MELTPFFFGFLEQRSATFPSPKPQSSGNAAKSLLKFGAKLDGLNNDFVYVRITTA